VLYLRRRISVYSILLVGLKMIGFFSGSVLESTLRHVGLQRSVYRSYWMYFCKVAKVVRETDRENLVHRSQGLTGRPVRDGTPLEKPGQCWQSGYLSCSQSNSVKALKWISDRQVLLCGCHGESHIVLLHCNLVIMLMMGAKRKGRYKEIGLPLVGYSTYCTSRSCEAYMASS